MGLNPATLPDAFKRLMAPVDKARETVRQGRRAMETVAEAVARRSLELERHDHAHFSNELLRLGIGFEHDNPTRRSSNRRGWPDYRCFYGPPPRTLFVEFKRDANKLSQEQEEVRVQLEGFGYPYVVAYCLADAIEAVYTYLLF
jgi:hypothetical protein